MAIPAKTYLAMLRQFSFRLKYPSGRLFGLSGRRLFFVQLTVMADIWVILRHGIFCGEIKHEKMEGFFLVGLIFRRMRAPLTNRRCGKFIRLLFFHFGWTAHLGRFNKRGLFEKYNVKVEIWSVRAWSGIN